MSKFVKKQKRRFLKKKLAKTLLASALIMILTVLTTHQVYANHTDLQGIKTSFQQNKKSIKGKVNDEKGDPLPGATIAAKDGEKLLYGTVTGPTGVFQLEIDERATTLAVSMMGFATQNISIGKQKVFTITLKPDVKAIDEVVVTGIFNKAKESFTGAATFIGKEKLQEFESRNILSTISNIDPSFNIVANDELGSDPNQLPEINIRGTSSIPNKSEAELETLQDDERVNLNTPLFILDGFEITLQRMMDLNQDEIESITILKDASATAIYGSQGANGVVVLTSTKPKAGKLRVTYRGSFNLEVPDLTSYNLLNAANKLEVERLGGLYQAKEGEDFNTQLLLNQSYQKKLKAIKEGTDTYWLSKPVQVGLGQTHSISLSGGDPAFRYSLNFSFRNVTGAMKGSTRDNFNGSVTLTYLLKNFRFTNVLSMGFNNSQNSQYGSFSQYAAFNPYWKELNEYGEIPAQLGLEDPILTPVYNPLYNASLGGYDKSKYTNIRENFQIEWSINEEFKISTSLGYSRNLGSQDHFLPPNHTSFISFSDPQLKGSYSYRNSELSNINGQLTLNYAKVIDKHKFFVGLNTSMREGRSVFYGVDVTGYAHDRMDFISMGSQYKGSAPAGSEGTTRSVGFLLNANYSYNNCYYADISYRLDGASSFGENSRFAPFYSLGLGWTLSRTKYFMENLPEFSNFRLRYSYGVTGSLQFSPYDAMTTYQYLIDSDRYDGNLASSIKGMGNPELKWQTTYQHNFGLDLSLWENAVSVNANYYHKRTEDLITSVNLPLSNGYTSYTENMGDVLNQGLEFNVSVGIIRNRKLRWNMSGAISHNRNKLLKLSDAMRKITNENLQHSINNKKTTPQYLYREGESMNALYVVPSAGIDPMTGKEMFINEKGNITYDYPEYYRIPVGLSQPKINGRLSSNWTYKNLRLNVGFSFRLGAHLYNGTLASKVETIDLTTNVDARVLEERWKYPGDQSKYKSLIIDETESTRISSRFVQKEKSFSLNSLSLDYKVPSKWLKENLKLSRANITYSTNDLFYISTVKKERGTGYPFALRHNFSLSVGF